MQLIENWNDYELLMTGNGKKIEKWGNLILKRPDPQAIWPMPKHDFKIDATYTRSSEGGGSWDYNSKLPEYWVINYKNLKFKVSPTNFKHTGLFPEQSINWDYMMDKICKEKRTIKVLNLFAYTGGATIACSKAGAEVVHVDSSKGMIEWAKENQHLSDLDNNIIRFICDDCLKFILREQRRGNKYDAIIMDPPSFGRGPKKEVWKFEDSIFELVNESVKLLSDDPLFLIINSYTSGYSSVILENVLKKTKLGNFGNITSTNLGIMGIKDNLVLPCGNTTRWENVKK